MTFVLVPGAGGRAWYRHRVAAELEARGHAAPAVDLPADDDAADLDVYADAIVEAAAGRHGVVLAAQSMGGLSAPLACDRLPVLLLVLVNAMIPRPGETGGEWWEVTGRDDRLFPAEFQRRVATERLGITPDEVPGGHLVALAQPVALADRLETYVMEVLP